MRLAAVCLFALQLRRLLQLSGPIERDLSASQRRGQIVAVSLAQANAMLQSSVAMIH